MALMILVNMGQLTQNTVARHLYMANLDLAKYTPSTDPVYSTNLSQPLQQHQGLRRQYYWGLYSVCGGDGIDGQRECSDRRFGHQFDPINLLVDDTANVTALPVSQARGRLHDTHWLHLYSRVGFYFLFVGTILTGLTFLAGLASEGGLFLLSSGLAFVTGAVLAVGAGMWTAVLAETRKTLQHNPGPFAGITLHFGQSLWMTWAAVGSALLAFIPFLVAFFLARRERKLYEERFYGYTNDDDYTIDERPSQNPTAAGGVHHHQVLTPDRDPVTPTKEGTPSPEPLHNSSSQAQSVHGPQVPFPHPERW